MGLRDHLADDAGSFISTSEFAQTVTLHPRSSNATSVTAIIDSSTVEAEPVYGVDAWMTLTVADGGALQTGDRVEVGSTTYRARSIQVMDDYVVSVMLERQ